MASSFIKNLFWPWIKAWVVLAWEEFLLSEEYEKMSLYFDEPIIYKKFWAFSYKNYMKKAFFRHWYKIAFMPWAFEPSEIMMKYNHLISKERA